MQRRQQEMPPPPRIRAALLRSSAQERIDGPAFGVVRYRRGKMQIHL
jgi:hypothetical protein